MINHRTGSTPAVLLIKDNLLPSPDPLLKATFLLGTYRGQLCLLQQRDYIPGAGVHSSSLGSQGRMGKLATDVTLNNDLWVGIN